LLAQGDPYGILKASKYFKLDGAYSAEFCPYNGIIQGCPLSMILLTSLVTTWIEYVQHMHPNAVPRSYADDLSITTSSSTKSALKTQIISLHSSTQRFADRAGMKLNPKKCFTFGNNVVKAAIPDITQHHSHFRLVGGSIKLSSQVGATELELDRRASWQRTIYQPPANAAGLCWA